MFNIFHISYTNVMKILIVCVCVYNICVVYRWSSCMIIQWRLVKRKREKIIRYFYHRTLMNPILFRCLCVYGDNGSSTSKIKKKRIESSHDFSFLWLCFTIFRWQQIFFSLILFCFQQQQQKRDERKKDCTSLPKRIKKAVMFVVLLLLLLSADRDIIVDIDIFV